MEQGVLLEHRPPAACWAGCSRATVPGSITVPDPPISPRPGSLLTRFVSPFRPHRTPPWQLGWRSLALDEPSDEQWLVSPDTTVGASGA